MGDRSTAASINMVTVMIVLLVVVVVAWFLFAGPGRGVFGGSDTNININPPAQQQPAAPKAPAPKSP